MLDDIRLFATIVEQTSLNKAAEQLNVSQPALSRRIARLEAELGVDLFRRVGKRLELTAAGQLTYEFSLELRRFHGSYLQKLNAYKSSEAPVATIGASLTTLQSTLPELIKVMTDKHPHLEIKAITGKSHEITTLVKERKVDFGLVSSSIKYDPVITSLPLFDDQLILVLPRTHYILERSHLELTDLNGLPMIVFAPGTWYRTMTDEFFRKYHLKPDVRMEIDSFEAIIRLLSACRAGSLLPQSYLREQLLIDNDLYIVHIKELSDAKRTTSLIHGDLAWLAPATRYLIEETTAHFRRNYNLPKELM
ncbi:MAG: LysR family transcriptional regulator [Candidatus Cohnella colombiensis]|uniref:LysR family transcriptional regulator n=1 Tax=Candidatus Cohnella colombiensis TaxID=3121368 RepID=A0AA95JDL5_9BACL|nr:MAG: LysR family transcriptional regulator [Cohnella sp.]